MCFCRDGASANVSAWDDLRRFFKNANSITCASRALAGVGEIFDDEEHCAELKKLTEKLQYMLTISLKACSIWEQMFSRKPSRYNNTRWFAKFQFQRELLSIIDTLPRFIKECVKHKSSTETAAKLDALLSDPVKFARMQIQLTVSQEALKPFEILAYVLEGDGLMIFEAFERLDDLRTKLGALRLPRTEAVIARNSIDELGKALWTQQM